MEIQSTGNDGTLSERAIVKAKVIEVSIANVNFDSAKSNLTPAAKKVLDKAVSTILKHGFTKVSLVGHTDSDGNNKINNGLSKSRADRVYKYLISKLKDSGVAIEKSAVSETQPVARNSTSEGKAANRRVEITLIA